MKGSFIVMLKATHPIVVITALLGIVLAGPSSGEPQLAVRMGMPVARHTPAEPAVTGLKQLQLGAPVGELSRLSSRPWLVARESHKTFWAYSVDHDHAWFVVSISTSGQIVATQILAKAHVHSLLFDAMQQRARAVLKKWSHTRLPDADSPGSLIEEVPSGTTDHVSFVGVSRRGQIERIGETLGATGLPALIRYYEQSGWSPDRAIPVREYRAIGIPTYLYRLRMSPALTCLGDNHWLPLHEQLVHMGSSAIDAVSAKCGTSRFKRTVFFALSDVAQRPFDTDVRAQDVLRTGRIASLWSSTKTSTNGTTGQIWFTTPNSRCILSTSSCLDYEAAYIDDPNNPLSSIMLTQVPFDGSRTSAKESRRHLAGRKHRAAGLKSFTINCSFANGAAKCRGSLANDGSPCFSGTAMFGSFPVTFGPVCFMGTGDPSLQPHNPHNSGANGCGGGPIDAISGKLWYKAQDAAFSGPFGIVLSHRYDSDAATYQGDLGVGWRHSYGGYIDTSQVTSQGTVTYVSGSGCQREYFQQNGAGTESYDLYSGDTLTTNSTGSYTLVTWDAQTLQFDSSGRLNSITDRIGNTQTINRDAQNRISSVADPLGRSISFTYDSNNRIVGVTSNPSKLSITLTYDTGTNCYTGDLCSVRESDGGTWKYQYYNPSSYGGNHLLEYVIDPINHTEEYNQYQLITLSSPGDSHYRIIHQEQDSGKNALNYTYSDNGSYQGTTVITDLLGAAHATTYTWNSLIQEVLSVSGPMCKCNGNQLAYTYDTFGRLLTLSEGANTETLLNAYGRDVVFTSPDGKTSYPQVDYPGPTQTTRFNIQTTAGAAQRTVNTQYYPLGDPRQDLPEIITEPSVDTAGSTVTTTATYSTNGLLTNLARAGYINGASTTYTIAATYDARGRVQTTTGPRTDVSQVTHYAYYPDTSSDYALRGQLDTVTDPLSHVTTFANAASPYNTYSIYGGPASITDANGVITDYTYDKLGRLTSQILNGVTGDTANLTTSYTIDLAGRLTGITKPLLNQTAFTYDTNNNPTHVIRLDSSSDQREQAVTAFDSMSRPTGTTLQTCTMPTTACSTWSITYANTQARTSLDQLSALTFAALGSTAYTYDAFGDPASATPGDSSYSYSSSTQFGQNHELLNSHLGLGDAGITYRYDLQFNRTLIIPAGGGAPSTSYLYDDFGRVKSRASPYMGISTFTYDPAGNMLTQTDGNGATTTMAYDALNRRTSASSVRSGFTTENVAWAYDNTTSGAFGIGRLKSMTDPSGSTAYTYERRGMLASQVQIVGSSTYTTTYVYDGNGNWKTVTLPSARVLTYTADFADRQASVLDGTTTYVSAATYEPFGPLASLQFGNGTTQTRTYSQRYLPSEIKLVTGTTTLSDQVYTENGAGFVSAITDSLNANYSRSYLYGGRATNMLTTVTTGSSLWKNAQFNDSVNQNLTAIQVPGNDYGLQYNRAQRLITINNSDTGTSQAVAYDAAGNEQTIGTASYTYSSRNHLASGDGITYTYDGFGRRVTATASAGTRVSLYDPAMHLQSESGLTSGAIAYDYIWLAGIPVAQVDIGGSTYWTATDHLGTPFLQTSSTGSVFWQADYAPFGAVYALRTSDAHQPLRMPGQEAEEFTVGNANGATGRFYNGFRWYRPLFGRYTQADPIEYGGGQYNLYSYSENNPVNEIDRYGLDAVGRAVGGAVGGAVGADIGGGIGFAIGDVPGAEVGAAIGGAVGRAIGRNVGEGVDLNPFSPGTSCSEGTSGSGSQASNGDGGGPSSSPGGGSSSGGPGTPGTGTGGGGPPDDSGSGSDGTGSGSSSNGGSGSNGDGPPGTQGYNDANLPQTGTTSDLPYANTAQSKYGVDSNHSFPPSFDDPIVDNGVSWTDPNNGYTEYSMPGFKNDTPGNFQVGITPGVGITHRFFDPRVKR